MSNAHTTYAHQVRAHLTQVPAEEQCAAFASVAVALLHAMRAAGLSQIEMISLLEAALHIHWSNNPDRSELN